MVNVQSKRLEKPGLEPMGSSLPGKSLKHNANRGFLLNLSYSVNYFTKSIHVLFIQNQGPVVQN